MIACAFSLSQSLNMALHSVAFRLEYAPIVFLVDGVIEIKKNSTVVNG